MLFGLKNAGATYQKLMTKIFKPLIGRIVEVYIDDIMVKSRITSEYAQHLEEIFRLMRWYNMKLTPAKCASGVSASKFLGFMVTQRGIEVNPDQIKAAMATFPLSSIKELQCLTSRLAALGRFITRFTDKLRLFFLTLKGVSTTGWTSDCEQAIWEIKRYLTQLPILSSPQPGEELYMYLAISYCIVNAILFHHEKDKEQRLIYYVSKVMVDSEIRYSKMEQIALTLKSVAQKLHPYFQAHQVTVLTNQPLRSIMHKPDLFGRMLKWAIELSEYGIKYQFRLAIKGQVMADFIVEIPQKSSQLARPSENGWWILHVD